MEYEQVQELIRQVGNSLERQCLNVYNEIAFEKDISDLEIDIALDYFHIRSELGRGEKIVLLDNLIAKAHKRAVLFSPAGLTILNILARADPKLGQVFCYDS